VSIRVIVAASADSGRSAVPPESIAERSKSRRNCGLPPDRFATTSRTCAGSGLCAVASCARRSAPCGAIGSQIDPDRLGRLGRLEARAQWTAPDGEEPRAGGEPSGYVGEEFGRGLVHVMHVVDLDEQLVRHHCLEEAGDGFVHLCTPVRFRQFQDLRCGGNFNVEHGGEERHPWREVRGLGRDLGADAFLDHRIRRFAPEFVHLTQQLAPHDIRYR
jgi:hypothetical protein